MSLIKEAKPIYIGKYVIAVCLVLMLFVTVKGAFAYQDYGVVIGRDVNKTFVLDLVSSINSKYTNGLSMIRFTTQNRTDICGYYEYSNTYRWITVYVNDYCSNYDYSKEILFHELRHHRQHRNRQELSEIFNDNLTLEKVFR